MNLSELYQTIMSKEDISYASLKPGKRIAVVTANGHLDVMKVEKAGPGRASIDQELRYMAVAKVCPGQASLTLTSDGNVHLNDLMEVLSPDDVYASVPERGNELGVLSHRILSGYWIELSPESKIKRVTKSEMKEIQGTTP